MLLAYSGTSVLPLSGVLGVCLFLVFIVVLAVVVAVLVVFRVFVSAKYFSLGFT